MKKNYINYILLSAILISSNLSIDLKSNTLDAVNIQIPRLMKFSSIAYSPWQTIFNTYQLATNCIINNIPGDFVECGVGAGAQIAAMAYAAEKLNKNIKIHLFDSFEGIPLAGPKDTHQPGVNANVRHNKNVENVDELLVSSTHIYPGFDVAAHSIERVKKYMQYLDIKDDNFIFYKGWFQHTLPIEAQKIQNISLLRLDGDLYESTKVCLEYLYPKVSKGGFIIIDDYSLDGCRKAVHEYLEKYNLHPVILPIVPIEKDMGPVYWQIQ